MIKVFEETVESPVRGKRAGNIKAAVMGNEEVVVKVIGKVRDHGETFAFHDDKGTDQGVAGKTFPSGKGVFLNEREVKVQKKGIIKLSGRLGGKETDIL